MAKKSQNLLIWSNLMPIGTNWIMAHILATILLKFKKKKKKKKKTFATLYLMPKAILLELYVFN